MNLIYKKCCLHKQAIHLSTHFFDILIYFPDFYNLQSVASFGPGRSFLYPYYAVLNCPLVGEVSNNSFFNMFISMTFKSLKLKKLLRPTKFLKINYSKS